MSTEPQPPRADHRAAIRTDAGKAAYEAVREVVWYGVKDRFPGALDLVDYVGDRVLELEDAARAVPALDAAYRERNAVVAALIRTNGWPAWVIPAPDADGWFIVYAESDEGQVSWHIGPDDIDLFSWLPTEPRAGWDGWDRHTNEQKYERVASLRAALSNQQSKGEPS
jgi:hypothetical protein